MRHSSVSWLGALLAATIVAPSVAVLGFSVEPAQAAHNNPNRTFTYVSNAAQSYTVPDGVTSLTIDAYGAEAARGNAGSAARGGKAAATMPVTPGTTLYVYVGQNGTDGGWNGGAPGGNGGTQGGSPGGRGGGASDVRTGDSLDSRIVVAGGAGGGGGDGAGHGDAGGAGGGGGSAATGPAGVGVGGGNGNNGLKGGGGGGGGGGGYQGGDGGNGGASAGAFGTSGNGQGGGGGSSYISSAATASSTTPGVQTGSGQVVIKTISIDTTSLPTARQGYAYSEQLQASGGTPAYSWLNIGAALPDGLELDSDGLLSGTPTEPATSQTYRFEVTDSRGAASYQDFTFDVTPGPGVLTGSASNIDANSATVAALVNANGQDTDSLTVKYSTNQSTVNSGGGTSATSINPTQATGITDTSVTASLTGLTASTTYYYRIAASNAGGRNAGQTLSFTTAGPPLATTGVASAVTKQSATLNASVDPNGLQTDVQLWYGPNSTDVANRSGTALQATANPNQVSGWSSTPVTASITGLTAQQTYYFAVFATNTSGSDTGTVESFQTTDAPTVTTAAASNIDGDSAVLNGSVNANGNTTTNIRFRYSTDQQTVINGGGTVSDPTTPVSASGRNATPVAVTISNLEEGTIYYAQAYAQNSDGAGNGSVVSFKTLQRPTATTAAASSITGTSATLNAQVDPHGISTSMAFEYADNPQFTNPQSAGSVTPSSSSNDGAIPVSANISSLSPSTVYYFRVKATNSVGLATGEALSFRTIGPELTITPGSHDFGNVDEGVVTSTAFTASNTGTGPLIFAPGAATTSGAGFTVGEDGCSGNSFAPGETCSVVVQFASQLPEGARSGQLSLAANVPVGSVTVPLSGAVVDPVLGLSASALDFGSVQAGQSSSAQSVVLTNAGTGLLVPTGISLGGAHAASFKLDASGCMNATLPTGQSCQVTIAASPSATTTTQAAAAQLNVVSTGGDGATQLAVNVLGAPTTTSATDITDNSAHLNGTVEARSISSVVKFEISTNSDMSKSTWLFASQSPIPASPTSTHTSAVAHRLEPSTKYYFRVVTELPNASPQLGGIKSFKTSQAPAPAPTSSPTASPLPTPTPTPTPTPSPSPSLTTPAINLGINGSVGSSLTSTAANLTGSGLEPGVTVTVTVHSTPQVIGTQPVAADGTFSGVFPMPAELEVGLHHVIAETTARGQVVSASLPFAVGAGNVLAGTGDQAQAAADNAVADQDASNQSSAAAADAEAEARASSADPNSDLPLYSPFDNPEQVVVTLGVSAFALLSLLGAGGSGLSSGGAVASSSRKGAKVAGSDVKHALQAGEAKARGDRSRTWRWPGVDWLDRVSANWPVAIAPRSPMLGRIFADGSMLRAMFGPLYLLLPVVSVVLALFAVHIENGSPLPPPLVLLGALLVIGVLDSLSGLFGVLAYWIGVAVAGGIQTMDSVRILLGVGVLWFIVPLLAGVSRPLRREPAADKAELFDRVADFVIASLIGAWAASKMVNAWPGLSGLQLPIVASAFAVFGIAIAALIFRLGLETLAAKFYPLRLLLCVPEEMPAAGKRQRTVSVFIRTAMFLFIAVVFMGNCWQLWVGGLIFITPLLLNIHSDRLPTFPKLYALKTAGLVRLLVNLVIGLVAGLAVAKLITDPASMIAWGFVLLSLPGFVMSLNDIVTRDKPDIVLTWPRRIAGSVVFVAIIALVVLTS